MVRPERFGAPASLFAAGESILKSEGPFEIFCRIECFGIRGIYDLRGYLMNANMLLDQLLEIERSIGVETNAALRQKVQEAEDSLLRMQKEMAENLLKESRRSGLRRSELAA